MQRWALCMGSCAGEAYTSRDVYWDLQQGAPFSHVCIRVSEEVEGGNHVLDKS